MWRIEVKARYLYLVKLQRSIYGLRKYSCMWYNMLDEYLLTDGYIKNQVCPCVFIEMSQYDFIIITVYMYDLNMVGTHDDITNVVNYLKIEFEMIDIAETKFSLGILVEHLFSRIFVHHSTYTKKVLDRLYMGESHPLTTPILFDH